jgi:hypothetical protein
MRFEVYRQAMNLDIYNRTNDLPLDVLGDGLRRAEVNALRLCSGGLLSDISMGINTRTDRAMPE